MAKKRLNKKLLMILAVAGGSVLVIGLVLFVQYKYRDPLPFFEAARGLVQEIRQQQEAIEAEVAQINDPEQAHLRRLELKDTDEFKQLLKEADDEFSHAFGYSRENIELKTEVGVELAQYYLMIKDYRRHRGVWAKIVEINPSYAPAKYQLVKAIYDICRVGALYAPSVANWTELVNQTEGYIEVAPEDAYGYQLKAQAMLGIYQAGGDENPDRSFDELDVLLEKVEQLGGPSVFLYDLQGQLAQAKAEHNLDDLQKDELLVQAEAVFQKAIDTFPDNSQGYFNRFRRYDSPRISQQFSQVVAVNLEESREALQAEANDALSVFLESLDAAIVRFPNEGRFYDIKAKLTLMTAKIHQLDPVIAIYQLAVTAEPDEPKWAVELGTLYRLRVLHSEPNRDELLAGFDLLRRALFLPKAVDMEGFDRMEVITFRIRNLQSQINLAVALVEISDDDTEKEHYLSVAKQCFLEVQDIIGAHNPNTKILQGTLARAEGNLDDAVKFYYEAEQELTTQGTRNPLLNLELFYLLREMPNRSLAIKHATEAAQSGHRSPKLLLDVMETLESIGNRDSIIQLNQIVDFFEENYTPTAAQQKQISMYKAKSLLALGEKEAASETLESMGDDSFESEILKIQTIEDLEQRVAALETLARDYPGKDRVVFELFGYYFNQGQSDASYYDRARELLENSLKHKPDHLGYQQMLTMLNQDDPSNIDPQALQAKYVELAQNISDPYKREKQLGTMLRQLGGTYASKGDDETAKETFGQAREHFLAAYDIKSEDVDVLVQAFNLSLVLEDWSEAEALTDRIVKVDSFRGQILNTEYLLTREQWNEALELLELIQVDHPTSVEVHVQLSRVYVGLGDSDKGIQETRRALELEATNIPAKRIRALLLHQQYVQQDLNNLAELDLRQMIGLVGEVYETGGREERFLRLRMVYEPMLMAFMHRQLSQVKNISDEARTQVEKTIDLIYQRSVEGGNLLLRRNPSDPTVWQGVAAIYSQYLATRSDPAEQQELREKIEQLYRDGLTANPNSTVMTTIFCQHLLQTGRSVDAEKMLQELLAKSSNEQKQEVRLQMVRMYGQLKDLVKAQDILEEILASDPDNSQALGLKADSFISQNKFEEAIEVVVKLREQEDSSQLISRQAKLLLQLKKLDEAAALLVQAREAYPEDTLVLTTSAQSAITKTDYANAIVYADQAIMQSPTAILAYELKARALFYDQQNDAAIEVMRQLRQVAGLNSVVGRPLLAQFYMTQSRYGDAIDELRVALQIVPGNAPVRNQLIGVMTRGKRWLDLEALYDETLELYPQAIDLHLQAATSALAYADLLNSSNQARLATRQISRTQQLLTKADQLCQQRQVNSDSVLDVQMQLYLKTGQYEKVLSTLNPLFAEHGDHPLFLLHKAEALNRLGQSEQAFVVFEMALDATKDNPALNNKVLSSAGRIGSTEAIIAWAQSKIAQRPDWIALHLSLAQAYSKAGQIEKGISSYESALKYVEAPDQIIMLKYAQSVLYLQLSNWEKSIERSREVLSLNSDHINTLNNLAYLLMEQGGADEEAVQLARRAHDLNKNNPDIADTYATALIKIEKYEDAEILLRQAIQQKQREGQTVWAEFYYHLGLALSGAGQTESARQQFETVLQQIDLGKLTSDKESLRQDVEAARDQL